jgi:hypothetical protein
MLTRRGMLRHVGAAGAAAATPHSGEAESAERSAVTFDLPRGACDCHVHVFADPVVFPSRRPRPYAAGGSIVAQARAALGHQFPPPALKKKLAKAFRFAPAVTSFAEQCGDLAEADIPEPVGLASQKGRLDHAYQTTQFVRGHLANGRQIHGRNAVLRRSGLAVANIYQRNSSLFLSTGQLCALQHSARQYRVKSL